MLAADAGKMPALRTWHGHLGRDRHGQDARATKGHGGMPVARESKTYVEDWGFHLLVW
jgi:hypothetical protein